jgi:multidrug efflux pump subunit AcrB
MMPFMGISINMISLFAFILVLGIVVDDAIVVGENVYSRIRNGEHPRDAAPLGTQEVSVVVTFGIMTTIMAFTPMLGLSGVSGKIWPNIPLVVIPTLLFSLIQSKLILPSHLALLKPASEQGEPGPIIRFQRIFARGLERFVDSTYRPILAFSLRRRYTVLVAFVTILMVSLATVSSGWIRFQFFPEVETDVVIAKIKLSQGVAYEKTAEAVRRIEEKGAELDDHFRDISGGPVIRNMLASIGTQPFIEGIQGIGGAAKGSNIGEVTIEMVEASTREFTAAEVVSKWRELVGEIPGAVELTFSSESAAGGNAIDLELVGDNLEQLEEATREVKATLANFTGVIDISDSNLEGKTGIEAGDPPPGRGSRTAPRRCRPSGQAGLLRRRDPAPSERQGRGEGFRSLPEGGTKVGR